MLHVKIKSYRQVRLIFQLEMYSRDSSFSCSQTKEDFAVCKGCQGHHLDAILFSSHALLPLGKVAMGGRLGQSRRQLFTVGYYKVRQSASRKWN